MATITAQILIGSGHPNDGGLLFEGQQSLLLSENSRMAWLFKPSPKSVVVWIPTVEHCLEDAFLMIAVLVQRDAELIALAKSFYPTIDTEQHVTLYDVFSPEQRQQLYAKCRQLTSPNKNFDKMIVSVFRQSHLLTVGQLSVIEQYQTDIEVCCVCYSRLYSMWTKQTRIEGKL